MTGPPAFRFYAGTPLTTKKGINIGSLFILDDKPRPELRPDQEVLLCTIAGIIMRHMEVSREAEQRKSLLRMSKALNAFVEGKGRFDMSDERKETPSATSPVDEIPGDAETPHINIENAHKVTFKRAADLLNDSLNVDGNGGVCFFDTLSTLKNQPSTQGGKTRDDDNTSAESESDFNEPGGHGHSWTKAETSTSADIISSAGCKPVGSSLTKSLGNNVFQPLSTDFIQGLLKHYPRGKLWLFDGADGLTSEEEDPTSPNQATAPRKAHNRAARRKFELETFRKHFPDVRELLFVPLWDAAAARWLSGCICWRFAQRTIFSTETEFHYVTAFANSIVAETSRLLSIFESRQKGDFIGSISHELRSPLHGILASAEFLSETDFDTFQESLVDTISSCGRTLLDTIEHILDFSKINSFERNWRNARKPKGGARGSVIKAAAKRTMAKEAPPMMSIFAVTEVAAIIEEVVEGVYAGQIYRDFGSGGFTSPAPSWKGTSLDQHLALGDKPLSAGAGKLGNQKDVEVILDISNEDYCFTTQPGALRRLVMNILGNSCKELSSCHARFEEADTKV